MKQTIQKRQGTAAGTHVEDGTYTKNRRWVIKKVLQSLGRTKNRTLTGQKTTRPTWTRTPRKPYFAATICKRIQQRWVYNMTYEISTYLHNMICGDTILNAIKIQFLKNVIILTINNFLWRRSSLINF